MNETLEQLDIFDKDTKIDMSTHVEASAGSGKTTVIVHVVIRAILGIGVKKRTKLKEIFLTTFTRNSTKEMRLRISSAMFDLLSSLKKSDVERLKDNFGYVLQEGKISDQKRKSYIDILSIEIASIETMQVMTSMSFRDSVVNFFFLGKKVRDITDIYNFSLSKSNFFLILSQDIEDHLNEEEKDTFSYIVGIAGMDDKKIKLSKKDIIQLQISSVNKLNINSQIIEHDELIQKLKRELNAFNEKNSDFIGGKKRIQEVIESLVLNGYKRRGYILGKGEIKEIHKNLKDSNFSSPDNSPNYKFLLVDEAQDMNPEDVQALEIFVKYMKEPPVIYMVGDPKQALYKFRGADPKYFKDLANNKKNDIIHFDRVVGININYRSGNHIIQYVNSMFLKDKEEDLEFKHHVANKKHHSAVIVDASSTKTKNISAKEKKDFIQRRVEEVKDLSCSIAIISHKNDDLALAEEILDEKNIKHFRPSSGAMEASEILLLILTALQQDSIYLKAEDFEYLFKHLFLCEEFNKSHKEFLKASIASWGKTLLSEGFSKFIEAILNNSNWFYDNETIKSVLISKDKMNICNDFYFISSGLYEKFSEISKSSISSKYMIKAFCDVMGKKLSSKVRGGIIESCAENRCINLFTVHTSKGLEFDVVLYISDLKMDSANKDSRSLYVALTRAVHLLYILSNPKNNFEEGCSEESKDEVINNLKNLEYSKEDIKECDNKVSLKDVFVPSKKYISYTDITNKSSTYDYAELDMEGFDLPSSKEIGIIFHKAIECFIPNYERHLEVVEEAILEKRLEAKHKEQFVQMLNSCLFSKILFNKEMSLSDVMQNENYSVFLESKFFISSKMEETHDQRIMDYFNNKRKTSNDVYLGILDVLIVDVKNKSLTVVDWKTCLLPKNRTKEDMINFSKMKYGVQYDLYSRSLGKIYEGYSIEFIFCYPRYLESNKSNLPVICGL